MIKILGIIMTVAGAAALVLGVLSVFGSVELGAGKWPSVILGLVFFFAGISLIKYRKDNEPTQTPE